ncbi:MAG: peptidoglycan-binding protein [Coleofasciculaceae cyanobacterium SM2_3_26]|nr:peptidoglycan-binding protein [Coleofasciculaceae cyanobacterium SM2_3_26]
MPPKPLPNPIPWAIAGAEVLEVQELLLVMGFNPGEADGDFGSLTEQAVVNFQQVAGLVPDGVVGVQTLAALRGTPVAVVPRQASFVLPRSPGGLQARTGEIVLRRGDIGDGVKDLQRRLQELGYYNGSINGIFDAAVEEAVIAFQQENRLQMDGEVGFETERALFRPAEAAAASAGPPPPTFDRALQRGDEGRDVEALQQRLQELGYYGGRADGEFGSKTESALVKFQQDRGLPASGVADAATLNSLGLTSFPTTQPLVPPPGVPQTIVPDGSRWLAARG